MHTRAQSQYGVVKHRLVWGVGEGVYADWIGWTLENQLHAYEAIWEVCCTDREWMVFSRQPLAKDLRRTEAPELWINEKMAGCWGVQYPGCKQLVLQCYSNWHFKTTAQHIQEFYTCESSRVEYICRLWTDAVCCNRQLQSLEQKDQAHRNWYPGDVSPLVMWLIMDTHTLLKISVEVCLSLL